MNWPAISVVIPVKNEASKISVCIDGILSQTVPVKEIIVIDSGSTDGTVQLLKNYEQVTLFEIPGAEFNHGETRNLGVSKATGEFVLLTVGDARPFNEYWIEELLKGFIDEAVAGVCGQQVVPHEKDKNPVDWFRFFSEPELTRYQFTKDEFEKLSANDKKNVCGWDDVTAMYRRNALVKIPFRKTSYSEDAIWAKDALRNGYAIVYNYKARVFHYHLEDADFTLKRTFTTMYFRYRHFGFLYEKPAISLLNRLRLLKVLVKNLGINSSVFKWYRYNVLNHKAAKDAHTLFMKSLAAGEEELDRQHQQLCGTPPIPLKTA
jgi:rhamnosyltransferase